MSEAPDVMAPEPDPWSYEAYKADLQPHLDRLRSIHNTRSGGVWILGNGPSLVEAAPVVNRSSLPKIGVNKALGLVWPLDFAVICHTEHLDQEVPGFLSLQETQERWVNLAHTGDLFLHGTSHLDRGTAIPISHESLFSRDLTVGASEGLPSTGGSVMLVAMQLAYWLGFREFFLAGFELAGEKFYENGPFSQSALDAQLRLFPKVAPLLREFGVRAYLVGRPKNARNETWPWIPLEEAARAHQ